MTTGYVLTDIFGTTTDMNHSADVKTLLKTPEMKAQIESNPSYRGQSVEDIVAKGEGEAKAGRKESKAFKDYLSLWDVAAQMGYESGKLRMPVYSDAESALYAIHGEGAEIGVFSSGGAEASKAGMKTNNLGKIVNKYYSQSQSKIGSKYKASSYQAIAKDLGMTVDEMYFVTDDVKEAHGAVNAHYRKTFLIARTAAEQKKAKEYQAKTGAKYIIISNYGEVVKHYRRDFKGKGKNKKESSAESEGHASEESGESQAKSAKSSKSGQGQHARAA